MASRVIGAVAAVAVVTVMAGCSTGSSGGATKAGASSPPSIPPSSTSSTPPPTPSSTPTTPIPAVTVTVTKSAATTPSATPPPASDLTATAAIRDQLLKAGAKLNGLPVKDYTALVPGETYYAVDRATSTFWAGAGLVPSPSSTQAQVSVQDDGSYLLFTRPAGGTWSAVDVGLAGVPGGKCPAGIPADVIAVWNWKPGTCRPPN